MKKFTFILVLAILSITNFTYGQEYIESISSVTLEAETATIEATYNNSFDGSKFYSGVVGFQFTITNVADTLLNLYFPLPFVVSVSTKFPKLSYNLTVTDLTGVPAASLYLTVPL